VHVAGERQLAPPITTTSKRPSSGSACGAILMPPPNCRPFAQMTLLATSSRVEPSSVMRKGTFCHAAKAATVAHRNEAVPPSRLVEALARVATSPVSPHEPTFANSRRTSASPSSARQVARPASMVRVRPSAMTRRASGSFLGMA
jgi:hypothetical protein